MWQNFLSTQDKGGLSDLKKIFSVFLAMLLMCPSLSGYASQTLSPVISGIMPEEGSFVEYIKDDNLVLSALAENCKYVVFLLNGEQVARFDGEGTFEHSIPMDTLAIQKNVFTVAAIDKRGREITAQTCFDLGFYSEVSVNDGASTQTETFDAMGDEYTDRTVDEALISKFSDNFGWTLTGKDVYMQRMIGKSGVSGDWAVKIIPYGKTSNANGQFKYNAWTEKVTSGTIVVEFDFQASPVGNKGVQISLRGIPLHKTDIMIGNANISATEFEAKDKTWVHLKYEYDTQSGTCNLFIDGTQYWSGTKGSALNDRNNLSQLMITPAFWSQASYAVSNYYAYIAIDNFKVYKKGVDFKVSDIGYTDTSGEKHSACTVPVGTSEFYVTLPIDAYFVEPGDISLKINGKEAVVSEVRPSGNDVMLMLAEPIKEDSSIEFEIFDEGQVVEGITLPACIKAEFESETAVTVDAQFTVNNAPASDGDTITSGDQIAAQGSVTNVSDQKQSVVLIVMTRVSGILTDIGLTTVNTEPGACEEFTVSGGIAVDADGEVTVELKALKDFNSNVVYAEKSCVFSD